MSATAIAGITALRVWDSRGRPTVEAEVRLAGGARGRAIAPAGASTGAGEAVELRDGGERLGGLDVGRAVAAVNGEIARALVGLDAADQGGIDRRLIDLDGTPDKARLGANALVAVSMAIAHAAAAAGGHALWRHLLGEARPVLPCPEVQIYGGGAHAHGRVDVQDFMIVPYAARTFDQALEWAAEIYRAAGRRLARAGHLQGVADEGGYWPGFATSNEQVIEELVRAIEAAGLIPGDQVGLSLDIAATQFHRAGRYRLGLEGCLLDTDGWCEILERWITRYPIVSIEDPLAETDMEGMARFTAAVGERVQIVGDDLLTTNAERVRRAAALNAANTLLVKPNQAGTLSEAYAALEAARQAGWGAIVSARSGETEDTTVVHLAVGWGVRQLKVGSFARSERMAKWNEALRIEKAGGGSARFAGATPFAAFSERRIAAAGRVPP